MPAKSEDNAIFQIGFKGIALTEKQKSAIVSALRSAMLAEIAKLDFREPFEIEYLGGPGILPGIEARVSRKS
ncbi:hypothetical protein [Rhizobium sp. BK376]|uniref:hypothetical protein n=1 Tax=Rhizobium sp. BK376 TaxID=2512149 RepID=UPI001049CC07|nr:hypothetical protein [Rhizobium sp. BK376]TCR82284.1 hypothetical protein EV561_111189 [Rhizobium sp. BK376]